MFLLCVSAKTGELPSRKGTHGWDFSSAIPRGQSPAQHGLADGSHAVDDGLHTPLA